MSTDYKFEGWCGESPDAVKGQMKWKEYEPKPFTDDDVDIKIQACGICGSDIHTLRSGWGATPYPCVVGHEIIGRAVRVGKNVTHVKEGDRVGVGAQASSCLKPDCEACADGEENHCPHMVGTYAAKYPDGSKSYGGYADYNRTPGRFVLKIPDSIPTKDAAPMMCAGITLYSPLKREGAGPGKKVGIVGLGGLGHFGVLFAKALGADKVVVISRTGAKKADAQAMGADGFIATDEDADWATAHANSLDIIVSTVSSPKMPLMGYLSLLRYKGTFIQVGAPEDALPQINAFALIAKGCKLGGSIIGAPDEIKEMLELAAAKQVKPWIQERSMKDANQAVVDMEDGKARYRYVLINEKHAE
ncbi:alcohol dehydrogenase [Neofusicoccum parvum]|uniref:alcohol dehydrogenase (NADP(+)) n=3 Tax=Neofusicoccum TaxID=407951 RepID=R1GSA8_BOTPV|nr:putative alcohol dehydrogenase superfamily zinc-containing protein [Neofusicoccum parvum UCRNP2]GME25417.1 alcohol dehydrogenase [Neofusicoccum parvum]GME30961.1 alcohol dehydrogenase [Neofusicoccum parvum]